MGLVSGYRDQAKRGITVPLGFLVAELNLQHASITSRGLKPVLPLFTADTLRAALKDCGAAEPFPAATERQLARAP